MASLAINLAELHEPSVEDVAAARVAARSLSHLDTASRTVRFVAEPTDGAPAGEPVSLPASIFGMFVKMLIEVGNGNAVALVPVNAELTTQQAADLLNVSRPHLVKLLNDGKLSCRLVGTHRKLKAKDVLNYREMTSHARAENLRKMVELDEELGLYDDEPVGGKD